MKTLLKSVIAAATLAVPSIALASNWEIDASHSTASFSVRHMMVTNVKGSFDKVSGTINLDDKDITKSTVTATIDATTINTGEPKRDAHLKSPDFFEVEKYKTITFKSKKVEKAGEGKLKVTGDLTLHGVTKEVTLAVEGPTAEFKNPFSGAATRGFSASTQINRKDFGLGWNKAIEAGGVMVGEEVAINLDLETVKKDAPATAKDAK